MSDLDISHDPAEWRHAFETTEPGPELERIRARVASARNRGENDAMVAVVLDEASEWKARALAAEAMLSEVDEAIERVEALAKVQAMSCQAQHRADHARNWLDVLAILERVP